MKVKIKSLAPSARIIHDSKNLPVTLKPRAGFVTLDLHPNMVRQLERITKVYEIVKLDDYPDLPAPQRGTAFAADDGKPTATAEEAGGETGDVEHEAGDGEAVDGQAQDEQDETGGQSSDEPSKRAKRRRQRNRQQAAAE